MKVFIDKANESIERIDELCIDCGICVQTCEKNNNLKNDCINCGQCILTCPTKSLIGKNSMKSLEAYFGDANYTVIVSTSPSVRVGIGDEFGYDYGTFLEGKMVAVLKKIGFDYVFDTTFGADLTVLEEANELIKRLKNKTNLPLITSCCPSWVLYMEKYHSEDLNLLSTCKSPIAMQGILIKNYLAELKKIEAKNIINVALTPCVSKKSEIKRPEIAGMDFVITTSELSEYMKEKSIDLNQLEDEVYDEFLSKGSGGGLIFGNSGGVTESALRAAYTMIYKKEAPKEFFKLTEIRGNIPMKEAEVSLGDTKIKVLVLYEIQNAEKMYANFKNYDFVEVMVCPMGCVGGAGQPNIRKNEMEMARMKRMNGLYQGDETLTVRNAIDNPDIKKVYDEFLGEIGSQTAEDYLHTSYSPKKDSPDL